MGYNADLFLALRDEELNSAVYFKGKSKKEVVQSAEQLADAMLDSGEVDSADALTRIVKLKDYLDTLEKKLRSDLESDMVHGEKIVKENVSFQFSEGSKRLNSEQDPMYQALKQAIKEREELLKVAQHSTAPIYDSEGIEVPKVGYSFTKSSIKITY
jgi:L-lysine 2,3-aminomutase